MGLFYSAVSVGVLVLLAYVLRPRKPTMHNWVVTMGVTRKEKINGRWRKVDGFVVKGRNPDEVIKMAETMYYALPKRNGGKG
jgi:hypothetical protein